MRYDTQYISIVRLTDLTVFLGEGHSVKLGDFGLSKVMQSHDFASTYVGTPYYMSPEICASERYTLYSDIWALGCIIYELCTTRVPFNAATHIQLIQKINTGKTDPIPAQYSQELSDVIRSCLKVNPQHRPDTAVLINHGKMRLAREKREVVALGTKLEQERRQLAFERQQINLERANVDADRERFEARIRAEIEEVKRREWEVRASLEITRQINILQAKFESEVQARVDAESKKRSQETNMAKPPSPPSTRAASFATSNGEDIAPTSDLSNLSIVSPAEEQPSPLQLKRMTPPRRKARGPLARSRTQFDSPMDVTMGEPSPVSIANLNLSPRRTAAANLSSIHNPKNIFAAAAQKTSVVLQLPTPPSLGQSVILEDEDEEGLSELPSPTRASTATSAHLKQHARPGLLRQKTAPIGRLPSQPTLFPTTRVPRVPSPPNAARTKTTSTAATGSPTRKQPEDMFRKVMARNLPSKPLADSDPVSHPTSASDENPLMKKVMHRNLRGQTLVELAQPRTGAAPAAEGAAAKGASGGENNWRPRQQDVVVWDPEVDEMPSPFLSRVRRQT